MERGLTDVVTGIYWDPILTKTCAEAGEGAILDIRLGGKIGPMSGAPIDMSVTIRKIVSGMTQRMGESRMPLGHDGVGGNFRYRYRHQRLADTVLSS